MVVRFPSLLQKVWCSKRQVAARVASSMRSLPISAWRLPVTRAVPHMRLMQITFCAEQITKEMQV